jgi:hypothetical protein
VPYSPVSILGSTPDPHYLADLLHSIAALPLPVAVRARIWGAMIRSLDADNFARELTELSAKLHDGEAGREEFASEWWPIFKGVLVWRTNALREDYLNSLLEECEASGDRAESLLKWVEDHIVAPVELRTETTELCPVPVVTDQDAIHTASTDSPIPTLALESSDSSSVTANPALQNWLFTIQGLESDSIKGVFQEIRLVAEQLLRVVSSSVDFETVCELAHAVSDLRGKVQVWNSTIPDPSTLTSDAGESIRAYKQAKSAIGADLDSILTSRNPSPRDLVEAADFLEREDLLRSMPPWVWSGELQNPSGLTSANLFDQLVLPEVRQTVQSVLSVAGERTAFDPLLLKLVPPPPHCSDLESRPMATENHMRVWFETMGNLLSQLPEDILTELRKDAQSPSVEVRIRQALGLERRLRDHVPNSVVLDLMRDVIQLRSEREAIERADLYIQAVQFWESFFGSSSEPTASQLKNWAERQPQLASSIVSTREVSSEIRIENNWIDSHGAKVPLLYSPSPDQAARPYGYISVPLVATSKQKRACSFGVECDVKSGHRDAWPRDWESPQPSSLYIPADAWRDDPDQPEQYLYSFKVKIPIRRQGRGNRFEFNLSLTEEGRVVAGPFVFSWDVLNDLAKAPLVLSWPEVVDPQNAERHPLGPQKKSTDLLARISQCGSFSITAPRRFGKSTLLDSYRFIRKQKYFNKFKQLRAIG